MEKQLYYINQGNVRPATIADKADYTESALALAIDETEALTLCKEYDAGSITYDNAVSPLTGETIAALSR